MNKVKKINREREKLTQEMLTEFGKKAYVSGASQPLLGAPFYYPRRKEYNL